MLTGIVSHAFKRRGCAAQPELPPGQYLAHDFPGTGRVPTGCRSSPGQPSPSTAASSPQPRPY